MPLLSREAMLSADDMEWEDVDVPQWGGTVRVRALTGQERDSYEAACLEERPVLDGKGRPRRGQYEFRQTLHNVRAKLVVRSVVDEDGNRIFRDQDAPALGEKSAAVLDRLYDVASRLSKVTQEDVEELAGKSAAGQTGDSPSSSPSVSGDSPSPSS